MQQVPGWLRFNLSPWSRLPWLPLSGPEEMEAGLPPGQAPGSGASGLPGTQAGIAPGLRGRQPASLRTGAVNY